MAKHKKHTVRAHERRPPTRKPPMPGQNEFSPEEETAMRQGQRQANTTTGPAANAEMAGMEDDAGGGM